MPTKILLADDSITIQKVVELTFSDGDYEVIATNNGNKAIEKLDQLRPDIILSDIIMPEKNGYELCEYVKSHPEYRNIPVILLTGTFEPFDPDRAEKAGCDAVVTKPFESQGLIQKVEQLLEEARSSGSSTPAAAESAASTAPVAQRSSDDTSPFGDEPSTQGSPFESSAPPAAESAFQEDPAPEPPPAPQDDLFGATSGETEEAGGETKLIPKLTFDDIQRMHELEQSQKAAEPADEPIPQPPPLEMESDEPPAEPAAEEGGGETKLIKKMTFDDIQRLREEQESTEESAAQEADPFEERYADASAPPEPARDEDLPFGADDAETAPFTEPAEAPGESEPSAAEPEEPFGAEAEPASEAFEDEHPAFEPEPPAFEPEAPAFEAEPPAFEADPPEFETEPTAAEPAPEPPAFEPEQEQPATAASAEGLSDEDVDRVARRVVELISDKALREIAWEVIPDLAEIAVKQRIREIESSDD